MSCPSCGARLRKARRGIFGKIVISFFWLFNLLMIFWIYAGFSATSEKMGAMTDAEKVGTSIGAGIGITILIVVWLIGAVILGIMALLTRPKAA
ncbi:hypothetical protein MesoLj113b_34480 [Mesorhizobium sp. 113-3-3]|nr:hypothetical protein MesoLj113b_34480 [Mesorhizobium sp. 113-3-3]